MKDGIDKQRRLVRFINETIEPLMFDLSPKIDFLRCPLALNPYVATSVVYVR